MGEQQKENMDFTRFDFSQPMNLTFMPGWLRNLESMSPEDRATLKIYMISKKRDAEEKKEEEKVEYTITTNNEGDLVAFDGKSGLLLNGREWKVPSATLEKLNKPKPPAPGKK